MAPTEPGPQPTGQVHLGNYRIECLQDISPILETLKKYIVRTWDKLISDYIKRTHKALSGHLGAIVGVKGSQIEK